MARFLQSASLLLCSKIKFRRLKDKMIYSFQMQVVKKVLYYAKSVSLACRQTSQKYDSFFTSFAYPRTAELIHNSKVRISAAPPCLCFILADSANARRQKCPSTQLDRHKINQRDEACDAGSQTNQPGDNKQKCKDKSSPRAQPKRNTPLGLARMTFVLQTKS